MTSKSLPKALNPAFLRAARAISKKLTKQGHRHALIGGLAVSHYGYKRTTDDVDFLLSNDSASDISGDNLGGEVEGKTIKVDGIDVDLLFPKHDESFLEQAIKRASGSIPIIPIEVLIYMKLRASRMKDSADIVELLKRGKIPIEKVKSYLKPRRPDLIEDFEALVTQAKYENK